MSGVFANSTDDSARDGGRGLERLRVCALLFEQAADKRSQGELMESLELRAEARALRREAYAMLSRDAAPADAARPISTRPY
jgi:hypothetical protein